MQSYTFFRVFLYNLCLFFYMNLFLLILLLHIPYNGDTIA